LGWSGNPGKTGRHDRRNGVYCQGVRMTGWSLKLGRVAGIDVYMHGTFLILLAWVGVSPSLQRHRLADAGAGVFILAIFAIIVLHELGHALTARHYGISYP